MQNYSTSLQHLLAELERIDLLIQAQVAIARQRNVSDEQFQGLVISEFEVDSLLAKPTGLPHWALEQTITERRPIQRALDQLTAEVVSRKIASTQLGITLRLDELARLFHLTSFDIDLLLVCLAPELDLRYERLYGYLQDDITKRRPSVDLALNLLIPSFEAKVAARQHFTPNAPLFKYQLLHLFDDPSHPQPPLLSKHLKVDDRIVDYLFEVDDIDARLLPFVQRVVPQVRIETLLLPLESKCRLVSLTREKIDSGEPFIFYFQGPYGVGKQSAAEALAREAGQDLLVVDGEKLLSAEEFTFERAVRVISREARLQHAVLYWRGFDALLADERRTWREVLLNELETHLCVTVLAGDATWEPVDVLHTTPFVRVELPRPTPLERMQLWPRSLNGDMPIENSVDLGALAAKFRFTAGQIGDAAATARNLARWRDPESGQVTLDDLHAACRLQSNRKLETLARKIAPHYTWNDIVLPADRVQQLREICNQVKYRTRVYGEWGFDQKLSMGKGLNVLFAGPSGTGKTMAAEIMAGELGQDLYKIDLSTVVSKYIGETEKNLARIFQEAETSNAILFFDEADALFGKRSEVRDSHDRYANIEISYLLQRMEEYDGIVILATNLHKNMDDAFVRRMHFTVEFPFPNETNRRRIWEKIWPIETPRSASLDFEFMAQRFEITGGNIRNIALAAAFLAADDGKLVDMRHLIHATQREYQKMGKIIVEGEFGEYANA